MSDGKAVTHWAAALTRRFEELAKQVETETGEKICLTVAVFGRRDKFEIGNFKDRKLVVAATGDHKALSGEYMSFLKLTEKIEELCDAHADDLVSCTCPRCKTKKNQKIGSALWCPCGSFRRWDIVPTWCNLEVNMEVGCISQGPNLIATIELK
jgi:hypothetical protein